MALSEPNIPRLHHILTVALKRDCLAGAYQPQGYTGNDLDMAILAYRLGGHTLLHAFSHCLALPSLHTLQVHRNFTSITPTIGPIAPNQLDLNTKNLILNPLAHSSSLPCHGYSVLMDEITLKERALHHCASNSVIGLCHSHSHRIDLLADGKVHLGKEMSVIAMGTFGDDETFPVLADPPASRPLEGTRTEEQLGPIFSFVTDRDSTWRAATELSVMSKLYGTLSHMQGLNLATKNDGEITLDFDYKHIFCATNGMCKGCAIE
ncbi:hypothetical protein P692DRAFT_20849795 [Suillus brevipes Sb2]|nr:hypothetical protein P692DRAFT_20849795 [Suillus brevipes Sb2]